MNDCEAVFATLKQYGFTIVDLYTTSGLRDRRINIMDDAHWNIVGHEFGAL